MQNIKEIDIDDEKIYLKKSFDGWRVVHPIRKDIYIPIYDKLIRKINWDNINWFNLITGGSILRLIIIAAIVLILIGATSEYSQAVKLAESCLNTTKFFKPYFIP